MNLIKFKCNTGVLAFSLYLVFSLLINQSVVEAQVANNAYTIPLKSTDISPLLNGEYIPEIKLKDASGKRIDLNQMVSEKPTILVFYRGGWCPFCSKQLAGLQDVNPELQQLGFQLIAISTDKPDGLMKSADKEHLDYKLLSDADLNAAKRFGLAYKAPKAYWDLLPKSTGGLDEELLLPVPAVFVLDRKGMIHFEYINPDFKQRLNANMLKVVAKEIYSEL